MCIFIYITQICGFVFFISQIAGCCDLSFLKFDVVGGITSTFRIYYSLACSFSCMHGVITLHSIWFHHQSIFIVSWIRVSFYGIELYPYSFINFWFSFLWIVYFVFFFLCVWEYWSASTNKLRVTQFGAFIIRAKISLHSSDGTHMLKVFLSKNQNFLITRLRMIFGSWNLKSASSGLLALWMRPYSNLFMPVEQEHDLIRVVPGKISSRVN